MQLLEQRVYACWAGAAAEDGLMRVSDVAENVIAGVRVALTEEKAPRRRAEDG